MIRTLLGSVLVLGCSLDALAGSAVAYDPQTGIYAYRYRLPSAEAAERAAMDSCRRRGGRACEVIVACESGGFGMVYSRRTSGGKTVTIGASCGHATHLEANDGAKAACNERLPAPSADCGGALGQCRCGGPRVSWRD
jgi:hypothetical protein